MIWKKTTHVFQTIGARPRTGSTIFATIGSTRNSRKALKKSAEANSGRISAPVAERLNVDSATEDVWISSDMSAGFEAAGAADGLRIRERVASGIPRPQPCRGRHSDGPLSRPHFAGRPLTVQKPDSSHQSLPLETA